MKSPILQGSSILQVKNPQTHFVTKELIKEAIGDFLTENPEVIQQAIHQVITELDYNLTSGLKRITDIELFLGLNKGLIGAYDFTEMKERREALFSESDFSNIFQTCSNKNVEELLYQELKRVGIMKNKDILHFLGWDTKNTTRATRLMKKMAETYNDVICEKAPGKKRAFRLLYTKSFKHNV